MNAPKKLCLDLCCGLGGFSKAFKDNPDWEVVTVDIERKFKPTIQADVRFLPFRNNIQPEVLLASPPCERFSIACHTWPKIGIMKAMELVGATFEAVARLKPKEWLIENPQGRLRWFLGKPPQTIRLCDFGSTYEKKTDLWGSVLLGMLREQRQSSEYMFYQSQMNAKNPKPLHKHSWQRGSFVSSKAKRAEMPYGLSQAILEAVSQ